MTVDLQECVEDKSGKSDQVWNHGAHLRSVDGSTDRTVDP
ncbi:hypothetical protein MTR67_009622 [Solanum verrucosum]|uniref:Uncharacterized protein n=1 Tax=Solanum verrucosum TaxID=315347 RepID=A0AAF0TDI1_SOLVR|nr:hypothetical protein MTR67_009622 [Solanum verrucosum]